MSVSKPNAPQAEASGLLVDASGITSDAQAAGREYKASGGARRAHRDDDWSDKDIKTLIDCWMSGWEISAIQETLGGVSYNRVVLKAFRLGLPSRKRTKQFTARNPKEDLLEITPEHPGYQFLDLEYTEEEVEAAYAPPPPVKYEYRECRNCHTMTAFSSKYLRWCSSCREEMNKIEDDSTSVVGLESRNL